MADIHRPAGIALLFAAFVLLLVASISTPFFKPVDMVHTTQSSQGVTEEVRYGIWGACRSFSGGTNNVEVCQHLGHGYSTNENPALAFGDLTNQNAFAGVESSWTKGLATHPVATAVVFVSFVTSIVVSNLLISIIIGGLGALIALVALAIDVAFIILTRHAIDKVTDTASTSFGPGFYLNLVGLVATLAAIVLLFIHRRENASWDNSDSGSFSLSSLKKPFSRFKN